MNHIGIDIGSTASKVAVLDDGKEKVLFTKVIPSGWNSKQVALDIKKELEELGLFNEESKVIATGYGRVSVPYADKVITEITAHGKGADFIGANDSTVIDIGGQDTKIIVLQKGRVSDFLMNDKCSAGTGKFIEVMANRLGLSLEEMFEEASKGKDLVISSTCTVFAESEVISLIGSGTPRQDICSGVVNSICEKVVKLAGRKPYSDKYFLTGGFSNNKLIIDKLSKMLNSEVISSEYGRFAGAIGAALV